MYIFILMLLIISVLHRDKKNENKIYNYLTIFSIFLIIFRFGVGTDYFSYEYLYNLIDVNNLNYSISIIPNMELLFKFLMIIFKFIGIPFHIFSIIISSTIMLLIYRFIRCKSPNKLLSLLLLFSTFYIVWVLSALRQGLVVAVLLNVYFTETKLSSWMKVLITLIMTLIHTSAILAGVMYLLSKIKLEKKYYLLFAIIGLLFHFIPVELYINYLENIPVLSKVSFYIDDIPISILSITVIMRLVFFSIVYCNYDKLVSAYGDRTFFNFVIINYVVYFLLIFSSLTASRISIYGYLSLIIVIPMIISLTDYSKIYNVLLSIVIVFSGFSFYKESTAYIDQSGYTGSFISMNFESIINVDRRKYSNFYNLGTNINEINRDYSKKYLSSINNEENFVDVSNDHKNLSVRFSDGTYGIINDEGEIIETNSSDYREKTIGNYVGTVSNPGDFKTIIYREIGTNNKLTFHETLKIVEEDGIEETRFNVHWYDTQDFDFNKIKNSSQFSKLNMSKITSSVKYSSMFHENISYLRINTSVTPYYVILNDEDEVLTELLYDRIIPNDKDGIAKGYTNNEVHYLNKKGEIIWIEINE